MDERVPLLAIRSIEFRGRKTASKPTLDSSKPIPTMFVEFTNDEYVFRMLELPAKLREVPDYNKLSFRRSVPSQYRNAYKNFEKTRLGFLKVRDDNGYKVHDARIEFMGHYLCLLSLIHI